ncbi:TonB-dependent receptor P3 [Dyadobacter sp. CECT 9623]|uniref:TonB-dependent receptor P3 n=1 Tax=Dyadobacter linearis TaxID=2823330 RepID=A0ABM8UJ61_9BACT|nr:TonB-dependent receptor [Dyadobacter sp. CECT 9623]CAG5067475.1 TonB-dependent receptor P3 [Dyadobacter sp. CECT 9623]
MKKHRRIIALSGTMMSALFVQLALIICFCSNAFAGPGLAGPGSAQELLRKAVSMEAKGTEIRTVLARIEKSANVKFVYSSHSLHARRKVSVSFNQKPLEEAVREVFAPAKISCKVIGGQIVINQESENAVDKEESVLLNNAAEVVDRRITGTVTDDKGAALPGVSIVVKNTQKGSTTDVEGNYALDIPEGEVTLIFSFVGYLSKEIAVGTQTTVNAELAPDTKALEEVVVVGYGTQKKRDVTGSVASINTSEIADIPVGNLGQKLQGKFAGVQVSQTNGEPGGGMSFRVRGQASINGGNSPLVVIDGFPTVAGITNLSPDEIESVSVLKDASASSLYGSRAANGVILITTKSAKPGETNINFSSYYGIERVTKRGRPDVMNAYEFAKFKKEYYEDQAVYENYTGGVPPVYQNPDQYINNPGTDWFDVLLRTAPTKNFNLGLSSGTEKFKTAVNLNYNKQEGTILDTYADRFSVRANNSFVASEKVRFGLNLAGSYRTSQITPGIAGGRNIIGSSFLMDPSLKYRNEDGSYPISFSAPGMFANPNYYLVLTQRKNPRKEYNVIANVFGEVDIIKGLTYKISANTDVGNVALRSFEPSTARGAMFSAPPLPPIGSYSTSRYLTWLLENTLTYNKNIGKHNFDLLAGYSAQKASFEESSINASQYPDDEIEWINAANVRVGTASANDWSLLSFIGRLNYNYDGKYLVSMAFRRDGSSRFGNNTKYGNFPSVSVGWVASEERLMKDINQLSYLKIRASYGKTGNNNIGDYDYLASVATTNYVFDGAIAPGRRIERIGNNNLTWETTVQYDLGLDLGLFRDRVFFTYDYYHKKTDGLLYGIDIPTQSGFSSIRSNIGQFNFWGHEFGVETRNMTGALKWNTQFNVSFNRNKAVRLGTNNTPIGGNANQGDYNRTQVGQPLGQFYGYVFDGVYMTEEELASQPKHASSMVGTARMKDLNNDGVIDFSDRTFIGNPNPNFVYGITNEFSYKNFDASIVMAGSVGNDIIDGTLEWTENIDGVFNVTKEIAERWRSVDNPGNGNIPRTRTGTTELFRYNNSRWVFDGSYLAVKNLTVGYTVDIKKNPYIKKARFYASGQNLLMFTNYPGMNPEVSNSGLNGLNQGLDISSYPVSSIYTLGVNIKF